jgi:hypothetical protein
MNGGTSGSFVVQGEAMILLALMLPLQVNWLCSVQHAPILAKIYRKVGRTTCRYRLGKY